MNKENSCYLFLNTKKFFFSEILENLIYRMICFPIKNEFELILNRLNAHN